MRYQIVKIYFHPPEADFLANEFRGCASQVGAYKQESEKLLRDLEATWSGNQKDTFISDFSQIPPRLEYIIEMFNNYATFFQGLQVTKEESVPVTP
jgi:uncharacterized protein YukE